MAYGTVLQEQRKALHERTGQALEALYQDTLEDQYSALAYHYSQSGNMEKAVEYLQRAGDQAAQRSAAEEAGRCFTEALEQLQTFSASPSRDQRELTLQLALGPMVMATQGWGAAEANRVFARAKELSQRTGNPPPVFCGAMGALDGVLRIG